MDTRAAQARENHRLSLQSEANAAAYRAQRDHLIRRLRAEDQDTWTYLALAKAVGCSKELIAHILKQGQRHAVLHGVAPGDAEPTGGALDAPGDGDEGGAAHRWPRAREAEPLTVPPDSQFMSKVVNAPTAQNSGGFEAKVTHPVHEPVDPTAGKNTTMAANLYEQRCLQEVGAH